MKPILGSRRTARVVSAAAAFAFLAFVAPPLVARDVAIPFDPDNFSNPLDIDNQYWPLVPGVTYVYRTGADEDCEEIRIEVTGDTRVVAGVTTRVVHETAYEDPECDGSLLLVEDTDDWHAQDDDGNIWYFGEDSRDCDENGCSSTPSPGSWEAGVDGAMAGIIMLAEPRNGDEYQQEFYEGVAEDRGKVIGSDVWVSLYRDDAQAPGEFQHCLKIRDSSPLEPGSVEHKFYCPDTGLVAIDELHGGTVRFELVDILVD